MDLKNLWVYGVFLMLSTGVNVVKEYDKVFFNGQAITNCSIDSTSEELDSSDFITVRYDLNYDNIPQTYALMWNDLSLSRTTRRENGRQYHSERNELLRRELNIEHERLYVSSYFPCIEAYYSVDEWNEVKDEVFSLSNNDFIEQVIVTTKPKAENQIYEAVDVMGGIDEVYGSSIYTGTQVKVGLLEVGVVDTDYVNLADTTVVVRDEWYYIETVTEHATAMASIIAGSGGVAPDAHIYSVEVSGGLSSEFDWLLDNDIDVCNMSFGYTDSRGTYNTSYTSVVDYAVSNYSVICVASTGNDDGEVCNPAIGYNVIGVGATSASLGHSSSTNYIVNDGPNKPNLSGFYCVSLPEFGACGGTSTACALITGFICRIVDRYPFMEDRIDTLMATMYASCIVDPDGVDYHIGYGLFKFDNWLSCVRNYSFYINTNTGKNCYFQDVTVDLNVGDSVKGALAWLANASSDSAVPTLTNYNLYLYDPNGTLVATSLSVGNPSEVIQYTATNQGSYVFRIYQLSAVQTSGGEKVSFCYRIY